MVSTRSNNKQSRKASKSPLDGDHSIPKELVIDGTAALRGGKAEQSRGKATNVRTFRGARYEIAGDGVSWRTTESDHLASEGRPAVANQSTAGNKRKRNDVDLTDDVQFLRESISRLEKVEAPTNSFRKADIRKLLPYLKNLRPMKRAKIAHQAPDIDQLQDIPDAYELSNAAAKAFLRSTSNIEAPIFLTGQQMPIIDPESETRPVEQIFDWLDMDEGEELDDLRRPSTSKNEKCPQKTVTIAQIQERFLENDPNRLYPWNFPEISLPTIAESMPEPLRHPGCNMAKDIACYLQSTDVNDICQESCPHHNTTADRCPNHFLTTEESMALRQTFTNWNGAIMLGEAGAITQPHFDSFGLGTYVCCAEGEIGFAWSGTALEQPKSTKPSDRWFFKVLRPGDAVYMDPGRHHLVFRLPGGNQTLGYAPRILRYGDVVKWLEVLSQEIKDEYDYGADDHPKLWRGIVIAARRLVEQARKHGRVDKFGGEKKVRAAEQVLDRLDAQVQQMLHGNV